MSTRLVILGLLRRQPLHGYELKHIIEESMGDWTSIAFGSIYFALGQLAEEGLVEKVATEREGGRPSRSIYQITAAGEAEFMRLLRQVWGEVERQYFTFDIGLTFIATMPLEEVKSFLWQRVETLEHILVHLDEHQREQLDQEHIPPIAKAVFEHSRVHFLAELDWTRALLDQVERGVYP